MKRLSFWAVPGIIAGGLLLAVGCRKNNGQLPAPGTQTSNSGALAKTTANYGPKWVIDRTGLLINGGCWCTEYVAFRIIGANVTASPGFPNAKDFGNGWLQGKGYNNVSYSATALPQNKDVVVIGAYGVNGVGAYGHVGFVSSAVAVGNGKLTIYLVGTNQTSNAGQIAGKCGCPDESVLTLANISANSQSIKIYRKSNPALACP